MEHFTAANRVIGEIQESLFPRLESCHDPKTAQAIEGAIDERIKQVEAVVDRLEIAVNKATPAQRSSLKFKLDQLKYDHKSLLSAFRTIHQRRQNREREQREREELLTRRFTTNEAAAADTQINIGHQEYFDNEEQKLHSAHGAIDEMLATGGAVLSNLRAQFSTLRGTRSRLMEVDNYIGLSNSVMRLIENRTFMDKFIMFGGMIVFTILMFLIWKYLT